jgi:hypothetical protein
MSKIAVAALAAVLALAVTGQAEAKKSNTARNIAIGVGAAVATGIILNEAAEAESRGTVRYYDSEAEHDRKCRNWMRKCDDGQNWACRKLDNHC